MSIQQAGLWFVYLAFMAVTAYAIWEVGYFGVLEAALTNGPGVWQVFADLLVSCGIACLYVTWDTRRRGVATWPWLITVPAFGSIPLITWMVVRDRVAPLKP